VPSNHSSGRLRPNAVGITRPDNAAARLALFDRGGQVATVFPFPALSRAFLLRSGVCQLQADSGTFVSVEGAGGVCSALCRIAVTEPANIVIHRDRREFCGLPCGTSPRHVISDDRRIARKQ